MKKPHLVCYDYQHGGVWAFVVADSPEEIVNRYPELEVIDSMPAWMTEDVMERIRSTMTIDVNDAENPFFVALVRQRSDMRPDRTT